MYSESSNYTYYITSREVAVAEQDQTKNSPGFIVLGVIIAILGALTVISATYNQYEDARQDRENYQVRECMRDQIQEIVSALKARGSSSSDRDREAIELLTKLAESPLLEQDPGDLQEEQRKLDEKRNDNKYPTGECPN